MSSTYDYDWFDIDPEIGIACEEEYQMWVNEEQ